MNIKNSLLLCVVCIFLSCHQKEASNNYLIEIEEFIDLSKVSTTKIIDFRKSKEYEEGHVENAINVWRAAIEDPTFEYGGMKASKIQLEKLFSKLGIEKDDTLVIYDDNGLCDAIRMWWVLQYYNFTNVKLINGGLTTLKAANLSMTTDAVSFTATKFTFNDKENSNLYASKEQMVKAVENNEMILDTRTIDEYDGNYIKKGAFRAGRIPNSKLIDWSNAIHFDGDKKLKSIAELKEIYADISHTQNDTIFVYCHSGVRSAHTTFVLTQLLGYKNVLNYDGSWTEWSHDVNLPIQ
jgi:thiosulfate/3-mercaptopyruvate sulfurtransferase